jgi:hypothetical protein
MEGRQSKHMFFCYSVLSFFDKVTKWTSVLLLRPRGKPNFADSTECFYENILYICTRALNLPICGEDEADCLPVFPTRERGLFS